MRAPRTAFGIAGAASFALVVAGCFLVTGSTDGYVLEDAGQSASVINGGSCISEGGCFATECIASRDCDAGEVCCLGAAAPFGFTCRSECSFGSVQLCATDAECGDAAACLHQQCPLGSEAYDIQACGLVPGCTQVVDAGGADAGSSTGG